MSITVPLYGFGGGGGAALDLKIIPGLDRPANPTPNMIWAKTDKEITGYALLAEKPENPTEGLLWLGISDSSEIKATVPVGKEYITLYFLTGAIYTSGAWTDVPVMSYQDGEWVDWFAGVYLFNSGNQYTDLTGGWTTSNVSNSTTTFGETIVANCVYNGSASWTHIVTKNKIDVTNYKKLYFDTAVTQRNQFGFSDVGFGIVAEQGKDNMVSKFLSEGNNMPDLIDTVEVNLDGYSGYYYVQMGTSNTHFVIKRVWME